MDREQTDLWCERLILGLVLAVLVYAPLPLGSARLQDFVVIEWLTVAILVVWFVRFAINPKHRLLWPPLNWAVLTFVIYAILRYTRADIEYVARQELIRVLVYAVLFYAILHNLHRQEVTHIVTMTLLGVGTLLALYGIFQHLTGNNFVWHFQRPDGYLKRGSGTFFCPNHLAGYLEMLLPLAVVSTLASRFKPLTKVFTGYAAFAMVVGIVTTFSRGGWVATGLSMAVLTLWLFQQRGFRLQVVIVSTALVAFGSFVAFKTKLSPNRFEQIYLNAQTDDFRFPIWGVAANMWHEHLWWGVGPGHFDHRYPQYRPADWRLQGRPDRVHNDYLNTLADWGMVGALLVGGAFGVFFWQVARSWRYVQRAQNDLKIRHSNKGAIVMGGVVGLVAVLFHSAIDFNFQIPANAILAVTLMALVAGHFRFASERYWHTVRWPLRIPVTLLLAAAIIYLGWQSWRTTRETRFLAAASAAPSASRQQIDLLQAAWVADGMHAQAIKPADLRNRPGRPAWAIEGKNPETAYRIGEAFRLQSFALAPRHVELAEEALRWFRNASQLDPFDPISLLKAGMTEDWIGRHDEAGALFDRARELDPNGYYTRALMGWHFFQVGDYEKAREWLQSSLKVKGVDNPIATSYLRLTEEKLAERAARR